MYLFCSKHAWLAFGPPDGAQFARRTMLFGIVNPMVVAATEGAPGCVPVPVLLHHYDANASTQNGTHPPPANVWISSRTTTNDYE